MENTQPMKTKNELELQAGIWDAWKKSGIVEDTESGAFMNSSAATPATTLNASTKTWTSAALAELKLKAGLVAGALAEFQAAGGIVAEKNIEHESGKFSVKLYLVAEGLNIKVEKTPDGLDFLVAAPSGIVAEEAK